MYLNPLNLLNHLNLIFRGAYATIAMKVSPSGLFCKEQRAESIEFFSLIFRGAYATIAIIVSPFGILKTSPFSTIFNSQF
jgi:hypothetical protein